MCCGLALTTWPSGGCQVGGGTGYVPDLSGQDKNYTFLACFRKYFQVLFIMPQIESKHAQTIRRSRRWTFAIPAPTRATSSP
jgi:hypothetical protein